MIATRHGDVSVLGRDGDIDISSQHGDVSVSDINGKVNLNLDHSSARVSQVASDVTIEGRADDVSIEDIKGAVHLNGDFTESVKLAKIAKPVSFKSARTAMEFSKLDGDLDLDSGDLEVNDITGPVRLETRAKDIRVSGVSGDLRLQDQDGAVEVHVNKVGSMEVDNRQGDIQIYLPDRASFQVDAHARKMCIRDRPWRVAITAAALRGTEISRSLVTGWSPAPWVSAFTVSSLPLTVI